MKVKKSLVLAVVCAFMLVGIVHAQEQQQPSTPPPVAPQSPSLDIQGIKSYLLGPGDVLDIRVFGQPELDEHRASGQ